MTRSIHHSALRRSVLLSSAWALWLACGLPVPEEEAPTPEQPPEFEHYGKNSAALTRARSCDDVLARIQDSTIARLIERAEELRRPPEYYYGEPGIVIEDGGMLVGEISTATPPVAASPAPNAVGQSNPLLAGSPVSESDSSGGFGPGFSGTTVQVDDVDEADIVKTEGDSLYLLQGGSLVKLRAWPAAETEVLSSTRIEGEPIEFFVHDGKALVYSRVYRAIGQPDPYSSGYSPYGYPYYYSPGVTKLTVLDMDQETPEVLRQSYVEGYYVSSRRHEEVVRTILDGSKVPSLDGVYIEYFTPFGQPYRQRDIDAQVDAWLDRTSWAVTQTEIGDWLPRQFSVIDGEEVEQAPDCGDYYQNDLDLSQSGVTQVLSLDLDAADAPGPLGGATVLARAERVYANDDVVLLSHTNYGSVENDYAQETTLHRFDIEGADTTYTASGTLPGYVHSQFSLDERAGVIRVSTTENRWNPIGGDQPGPKNRVFTLATANGWLDIWGQTEVFGENEQIFATRFIGDLGYVVTFRQTDPLFVVDLSSPATPEVKGELVIPGFSNFLYPLGQDHLLSIGRDASPEGFAQGLALQIFDVADPWYPRLAHKYVYSGDGYSDANADHRALTFHPELDRIAFPLYDYRQNSSSLEVFDLSVDTGFDRRGAITPAAIEITLEECVILLGYGPDALDGWLRADLEAYPGYAESLLSQCRNSEQMRRGVFRGELVYGISTQAVYAHSVDGLSDAPLARASLPSAYYDYYYGGGGPIWGTGGAAMGSGGGSFEGSAGAAGAAGAGGDFSGEGGSANTAGAAGAAGAGP